MNQRSRSQSYGGGGGGGGGGRLSIHCLLCHRRAGVAGGGGGGLEGGDAAAARRIHRLDHAQRGGRARAARHLAELEARHLEQPLELLAGALLAPHGHQHVQVKPLREVGVVEDIVRHVVAHEHLEEQDPPPGRQGLARVPEDGGGVSIVPIVDYVLHHVGVAPLWDGLRVEEGALGEGDARAGAGGEEAFLSEVRLGLAGGEDFGAVEEHALQGGLAAQQPREQEPRPAPHVADVGHLPAVGEVEGADHAPERAVGL
mmetsp:Transcript_14026/g.44626  ORF Transcript_14026/g.44626 Transcript_14026/m.44626 type:complete len:258 (+) Transcript_14026:1317-2090(+)